MINAISTIRPVGAANGPAATGRAGATAPTSDFSKVLADVAANAVDTLKSGEAAAIGGIGGNTSLQNVVQAVMSAEEALQTAIAVRDKLLSAYQEISRMAI